MNIKTTVFLAGKKCKDPHLTLYTKINCKRIKGLTVRFESVKLLEINMEGKTHDIGLGNNFFI